MLCLFNLLGSAKNSFIFVLHKHSLFRAGQVCKYVAFVIRRARTINEETVLAPHIAC